MKYRYKGINAERRVVKGHVQGENQWEVLEALKSQGISCIWCRGEEEEAKAMSKGKISYKDLALINRTLKNNMKSGIPITSSLKLAVKHMRKKQLIITLQKLHNHIEKGSSLSEALNKFEEFFPKIFTSMVTIGEESGNLEGVFSKMEIYFRGEDKRRKTMVNIAIYPLVIFIAASVGAYVIITKFMPSFFSNMKININEVPFVTRFYMNIADFFVQIGYFIIPLAFTIFLILIYFYKKVLEDDFVDRVKYTSIITKGICIKSFCCRFTMALHMTLSCGIDIKSAFYLLEKSETSAFIKEKYAKAREELEKGMVLSQVISNFNMFPEEFLVSILLGEESGNLEEILQQSNEIFEEDLKNKVEVFMKLFEPALILVAGFFLLSIYAAIMIPIYSIYST